MPKKKVEVYNKDQLIYPYIESDHVTFSNGMKVNEMLDQSISMPTVIHEDLSFKVGVGDQDVSSAIVDSSASEMTIKGKTYQNILPEPSTHVLTNNKEMFKVNEGLDPNVEIVDGVSKSAILKGNTLLVDELGNECEIPNSPKITIGAWIDTNTGVEKVDGISFYTGFLKCPTVSFIVKGNNRYKRIIFYDKNKNFISGINTNVSNNSDVIIDSTNIPSNAFYLRISASPNPSGAEYIPDTKLLIEDMSGNNLYSTQLMSVKMPVLTTTGKNLFDKTKIIFDKTIDVNTGVISGYSSTNITDFIKVIPNTQYTISFNFETKAWTRCFGFTEAEHGKYATDVNKISNKCYFDSSAKTITFTTSPTTKYVVFLFGKGVEESFQLEQGSTATPYEPYKSNILHTPEEVVLRKVNEVQDTLNLNTREYVQRIGEVVLDGGNNYTWSIQTNSTNTIRFQSRNIPIPAQTNQNILPNILCDKLKVVENINWQRDEEQMEIGRNAGNYEVNVRIAKTKLSGETVEALKNYLQANPITVQYQLVTPIVKTVDLSSSGNWEKVVLDGSEDEVWHNGDSSWANKIFRLDGARHTPNIMNSTNALVETGLLFSSHFEEKGMNHLCNVKPQPEGVSIYGDSIFIGSPQISTIGELRTWLSQNPITVWYQTTTHKDSTQVKQPIFFKDGHIQLSSGADNSLIPTLDYQAKTSNSYVMDLMKTNTRYTMKAKSASGTFTIDGTSYGAGTNGTFTTPSSMTNKLLVMSNKTNEEVMILEGDVTSKTIPYFKGIKSAFEDESKIEVLSTGKNLIKKEEFKEYILKYHPQSTFYVEDGVEYCKTINSAFHQKPFMKGQFKKGTRYTMTLKAELKQENKGLHLAFRYTDDTYSSDYTSSTNPTVLTVTSSKDKVVDYVYLSYGSGGDVVLDLDSFQLTETDSRVEYEPYKSNITKIPLLSPLRSLPNGVCDEIILDREKNKATLIQRVGHVVFSSNLSYNTEQDSLKTSLFTSPAIYSQASGVRICDRFLNDENSNLMLDSMQAKTESEGLGSWSAKENFNIRILVSRLGGVPSTRAMTNWLKENPVTILYHLKTPIITEVDLEGFPYIYKDGYIFLNSEIAPTMEITYSINQGQQISASNEDIIRHEKELTYLQKLIAQYVQVDYESALLSLKV